MERIAGIHAVYTVSTRRVTDSTEVVCLTVQKGRDVTGVSASHMPTNTLIIVAARYIFMTLSLIKNIEIFFTVFFPEIEKYAISSSDNLPVTVAILVCACVLIIIGVVITICVIR